MSSSEWQTRPEDPFARVVARVEKIGREAEQRVNYLLRNAGLRVAEGALHVLQRLVVEGDQEVTGSLDVTGRTILGGDTSITGDTDVTGDLDVEGRAGFTGDTEIGGNLSVTGTLSLPSGIIDNDALANPVTFRSDWDYNTDMAIHDDWDTIYATATITVPAGFTRIHFNAVAVVEARNLTPNTQYLMARIRRGIDGQPPEFASPHTRATAPSQWYASVTVPYMWSEDVTPGTVHTFYLSALATDGWQANVGNVARLDVTATFSR